MFRLRNLERFLPPALLFLIIGAGLAFYLDYNRSVDLGSREVIGYITYKYNLVQRKFDDQVVWANLQNNSMLANRDTVRSEDYSEARIHLRDGTVINVDANTMIYLELTDDRARIHFRSGAIRIDQSENGNSVEVQAGERQIRAEGADFSLGDGEGGLHVAVERGQAELRSGNSLQSAGANQSAVLGDSNVAVRDQPVRAQSPANLSVTPGGPDGANVSFRWELVKPLKDLHLQISAHRDFRRLERNQPVSGGAAVVHLSPGGWYWRLQGVNEQGRLESTEPRKVAVVSNTALRLFAPADNERLSFLRQSPTIQFSWSPQPLAREFELQLASDPGFQNIVRSERSQSAGIGLSGLAAGQYYWRVRSIPALENVAPALSVARRLQLRQSDRAAAPSAATPGNNAEVPANQAALLTWNNVPEARRYRVIVSPRPDLSAPVLDATTSQNFIESPPAPPGAYYWRVEAETPAGTASSPLSRFNRRTSEAQGDPEATPAADAAGSETAAEVGDQDGQGPPAAPDNFVFQSPASVRWRAIPGARSYRFQLRNSGGRILVDQRVSTAHSELQIPDGAYQVRAGALDGRGQVAQWSAWRALQVTARSAPQSADAASASTPPEQSPEPSPAAERSDWENSSFAEYLAYVQRLDRRCGPRETPDLLIDHCQDSYVTLRLANRERRDVFFFIRLIGGNLYRRMDAYRYFGSRCPPVFQPAREFMLRRQADLANTPEFDEKRSLSNALTELSRCQAR
ncbi:MAG: FecR domain-containing protein [Leptospirales bacterium]|nr:FecR domain-containing protein [Leptospirales bacterium]